MMNRVRENIEAACRKAEPTGSTPLHQCAYPPFHIWRGKNATCPAVGTRRVASGRLPPLQRPASAESCHRGPDEEWSAPCATFASHSWQPSSPIKCRERLNNPLIRGTLVDSDLEGT